MKALKGGSSFFVRGRVERSEEAKRVLAAVKS